MAFMKTCCCCCDLRTGVIVIAVWNLIASGYNVVAALLILRALEPADAYFILHPYDTHKYGFGADSLEGVRLIMKITIGFSAVQVIAAICLLVPACPADRYTGRRYRNWVFVWVAWSSLMVIFSLGSGAWIAAEYVYVQAVATSLSGYFIYIPLAIYYMLVVIAFYIELGEDPVVTGGVVVQQPIVVGVAQFNQPPPTYPGYAAPGQPALGYPVPGQPAPGYPPPGQPAPGYPPPSQPAPGYPAPGYGAPGPYDQSKPGII